MEQSDRKKVFQQGGKLLSALLSLLCVVVVLIFFSNSWHSYNRSLRAAGQGVSTDSCELTFEYSFDEGTEKTWTALSQKNGFSIVDCFGKSAVNPGDTGRIFIRVSNPADARQSYTLTQLGLVQLQDTDEIPILNEQGTLCYFGTQITAILGETPTSDLAGSAIYREDSQKHNVLETPVEVAAGQTLAWQMTLQFVDTGEDQNAYQNFGTERAGGRCARGLYFEFA